MSNLRYFFLILAVAPHISLACALPLRHTYFFLVLAVAPHISPACALLGEAGLEAAFGAFCVKSCAQPRCPAAIGMCFRCCWSAFPLLSSISFFCFSCFFYIYFSFLFSSYLFILIFYTSIFYSSKRIVLERIPLFQMSLSVEKIW